MAHSISIAWCSSWDKVTEFTLYCRLLFAVMPFSFTSPVFILPSQSFDSFTPLPNIKTLDSLFGLILWVLQPKGKRYSKFPKVSFFFSFNHIAVSVLWLPDFFNFSAVFPFHKPQFFHVGVYGKLASLITNGYGLVLFTIFLFHI